LDKPECMTILSGMSSMEQADDNLRIFSDADVGCLSEAEKKALLDVRKAYEARIRVGCTGCEYCQPCPQGIAIPKIFKGYDKASIFNDYEDFRKHYNAAKVNASACVECGACVSVCPQHFKTPIPEMLKQIHEQFGN
ncbi:MAG: 4Fe-4S dicluster domain-containing protein, partial [Clostridia bacterium]|nr:4Fe-4S dicluster domain-containing protein [Clostridia bacterium]